MRRAARDRDREVVPPVADVGGGDRGRERRAGHPVGDATAAVEGQDPASRRGRVAHQRDAALPEEPALERAGRGPRRRAARRRRRRSAPKCRHRSSGRRGRQARDHPRTSPCAAPFTSCATVPEASSRRQYAVRLGVDAITSAYCACAADGKATRAATTANPVVVARLTTPPYGALRCQRKRRTSVPAPHGRAARRVQRQAGGPARRRMVLSEGSGPGQCSRITSVPAARRTVRSASPTTIASSSWPAMGMKSGMRSNGMQR